MRHFLAILLLAAASTSAQEPLLLDEHCTATVGNQTALVQPDGSFQVRNVAIFQAVETDLVNGPIPQLFRVRATCVRDGRMTTGQSGFFTLDSGQTAFVADVFPTEIDPIPAGIGVTTSAASITPVGCAQLTVRALMPDGSVRDVTQRASGTTYVASNPAVLAVDENGYVEGRDRESVARTGRIVVVHEGHLAVVTVTVGGVSNDLDGDGMPNDYEELYGLDPETPDASGDLDGDGLANVSEHRLGTLPNQVDTDLDGLGDLEDPDPLRGDRFPPTIKISFPAPGATVTEGDTIVVSALAEDDVRVVAAEVFVNGESFARFNPASDRKTLTVRLTVPFEATSLSFKASASDHFGNLAESEEVVVVVATDRLTEVSGSVVDRGGVPVEGAEVTLRLHGMLGEFFDFDEPLTDFPDLTGRAPDAARLISSLSLRNPDGALSPDTFGVDMAPDFAARFSGFLEVPPGTYSVVLGADDGARLAVDGQVVAQVVGAGDFVETTGSFTVGADSLPVEIEYFQSVGDAEIRLAIHGAGGQPLALPGLFPTATDADGGFVIAGVPTILGDVTAEAMARLGEDDVHGASEAVRPMPAGVTDVGEVSLVGGGDVRILLLEQQCASESFFPTALSNLGLTATVASSDAEMAALLAGEAWDVVLIDGFGQTLTETRPAVRGHVTGGGRVFMATWQWTEELAASFEADLLSSGLGQSDIVLWDVVSPLLVDPNLLRDMSPQGFTACFRDDSLFAPLGGGVVLASSSADPDPTRAKLIVGNQGRTVLFGGKPGNFIADDNFDGKSDGIDLAENVITFLVVGSTGF